MTLHVPRLPFSLDPLMAEAKRRMRRRRVLVAAVLVLIGALAFIAVIASRSPGGPGSAVPPGGQQAQHPGASGGSSGVQAIAHKWAKYFGDPDATVVRTETVPIRGARPGHERWAMIRMKSRHAFRVGCISAGPGLGGSCHARYLEVGIDLTNHEGSMYWGLTASEVSAIAAARMANSRFRIFPDTTGLYLRCAIPRGGQPGGVVTGTCSTVAAPSAHVRQVEFIETWGRSHKAGWVVTLNRGGRVQSIRVTGQPAQLWK